MNKSILTVFASCARSEYKG